MTRVEVVPVERPADACVDADGHPGDGLRHPQPHQPDDLRHRIRHAFIITAQMNPPPSKVLQRTAAAGGRR